MKSLFHLCVLCFYVCRPFVGHCQEKIIINDSLWVLKIKPNVLQHVTEHSYPSFGRFTSNGLIYIDRKEAVFFDTPYSIYQSEQLLGWFNSNFPEVKVKGIVVNHFHEDALGGLSVFHARGIPSYAHRLTPSLLEENGQAEKKPKHVFDKKLELKVGSSRIVNYYFGEAHSPDNIVSYLPKEKVLFGGCMVKARDASKGNLSHANVKEWPVTVKKVRNKLDAEYVVPGHGDAGGVDLLDYTIKLFSENPPK